MMQFTVTLAWWWIPSIVVGVLTFVACAERIAAREPMGAVHVMYAGLFIIGVALVTRFLP